MLVSTFHLICGWWCSWNNMDIRSRKYFLKAIKVPFLWRIMGEAHSQANLDIFMSYIFSWKKGLIRVKWESIFPNHLMLAYYFAKTLMGECSSIYGVSLWGANQSSELTQQFWVQSRSVIGNHIRSSDWSQSLKVKYIALENSDSHTAQRWNKEMKWMMNQYQIGCGSWIRMKKIQILTKYRAKINGDEIYW